MRLPTGDQLPPDVRASLRRRPLFAPFAFPIIGSVLTVVLFGWLYFAYQHTQTIIIAVCEPGCAAPAGQGATVAAIINSLRDTTNYAVEPSPFSGYALLPPGEPMRTVPADAVPGLLEEHQGPVLLVTSGEGLAPLLTALHIAPDAAPFDTPGAGVWIITRPKLGRDTILLLAAPVQ